MKISTTEYSINAALGTPLRFAFLSDLHDAENLPIIQILTKLKPNAVLVGGDFIHSRTLHQRGMDFISHISGIFPTFVSLGNHESTVKNIRELVENTQATLLDNSYTEYCGLYIGGLSSGVFYKGEVPDTAWLNEFSHRNGYKLLLCHHPEYYQTYIRGTKIDLTLSGHAHGGQWRVFGRGIYAPCQGLFPKYTSGIYENRLIVGRGIGNKACLPRINNRPEIILLKIY